MSLFQYVCNTKHILWISNEIGVILFTSLSSPIITLAYGHLLITLSMLVGQSQIIFTAEYLFFRIPPSLNMLRIQDTKRVV